MHMGSICPPSALTEVFNVDFRHYDTHYESRSGSVDNLCEIFIYPFDARDARFLEASERDVSGTFFRGSIFKLTGWPSTTLGCLK